jgi:hypothetical protein
MGNIRYDNTFSLVGGFNIKSAEPIDVRMFVNDINDIYLSDNWKNVKPYPGLIVSAPDGQVRIYVGEKYDATKPEVRPWENLDNWKEIGGKVEEISTKEIEDLFL